MPPDQITPEMAKRAALRHLKGIYYHGTVEATEAILNDRATPAYQVSGVITPKSRNLLARFIAPNQPYRFTARVHATTEKILGYEVV
jgi:hypothetical protein